MNGAPSGNVADRVRNELPSQAGSLADRVEELTARLKAGETVDMEAYLEQCPGHASELRRLLPALELLAQASRSGSRSYPPSGADVEALPPGLGELGDFRLIREVGRGGMGVVYEAEQISLGRRVALKVLPFAATMDPRHLQRFQNEARAAACLHHEHIVPVYGVGSERGVHFFAMQFVEGQTVAALIAAQQRADEKVKGSFSAPAPDSPNRAPTDVPTTADIPVNGRLDAGAEAVETANHAAEPTAVPPRDAAFYRQVAEWGIQAAEALEHAHSLGIVHRDVKPGNLMIDSAGKLWVTDFGLARTASDTGLTMTGDLLGTLRYMSPEQALAKHGLVDHRTDIYALGVTLYEMLTFAPATEGADREEILRKIAFEEPRAPRKRNKSIPQDLETIVLKAMNKESQSRYGAAKELAEDLRRFIEDKTINAMRPGRVERIRKWMRRNRPTVWAAAIVLFFAVVALGGSIGWVSRGQILRQEETEQAVAATLVDMEKLHKKKDWFRARELARRAQDLMRMNGGSDHLQLEVAEKLRDYDMALDLEEIRLEMARSPKDDIGNFDTNKGANDYRIRFQKYGIDVFALSPADAAELIRSRSIAAELVEALDDLASILKDSSKILMMARLADADDFANNVRDALAQGDLANLKVLASSDRIRTLPPSTLRWVCHTLQTDTGDKEL